MASLSTLRGLFYVYLGTKSTDPKFPTSTANALINAAANKYAADVQQQNASWLESETSLASATRSYALPANFAGALDVRLTDEQGQQLIEVRGDELAAAAGMPAFAITGPDGTSGRLKTSRGVTEGAALWLKYRYQPAELVNDIDVPSWMPSQFHDLLAREAALDAFGLGNEGEPGSLFVQELFDRRAQFWAHIGRRGVAGTSTRSTD